GHPSPVAVRAAAGTLPPAAEGRLYAPALQVEDELSLGPVADERRHQAGQQHGQPRPQEGQGARHRALDDGLAYQVEEGDERVVADDGRQPSVAELLDAVDDRR